MSESDPKLGFWDAMQKSAESARSSPTWMKAGINLSERNFTTYRDSSPPEQQAPKPIVAVEEK